MPDKDSLSKMYNSFVCPTFEYANIVWDSFTQYDINRIERLQIAIAKAARIVTGGNQTCLFRHII